MSSDVLQTLIKALGGLGFLLIVGMFLRAKVSLFKKMLIPASVLGGFVGLLLGPEIMGTHAVLPVPEEWRAAWSYLPGILIVPIFAAIPLGNFKKKSDEPVGKGKNVHKMSRIAIVTGIHAAQMGSQIALGVGVALLLGVVFPHFNIYNNFGFEMSQGFNGGHGTAGAVGNILLEAGIENWELVQGVATTFATIGLLGGITTGIIYINRASKKGETVFLKDSAELPASVNSGVVTNIDEQVPVGRETTSNSNIECLTVHLGLILFVTCLAYITKGATVKYDIKGFKEIPVWPYALIIMHIVNFIIVKLKLEWMIDSKVKGHLSGMLADFAICAAIASMPVRTVMAYIVPMLIVAAFGFTLVYWMTIKAYKFFLPDSCPFERGIFCYGMGTGVMMTGMALLKICDPDFETPTLEDFSVSNIVISMTDLVALPIMYYLLAKGTSQQMVIYGLCYTSFFIIMALTGKFVYNKTKPVEENDFKERVSSKAV